MNLEELKKSWNTLDQQLQKEQIANGNKSRNSSKAVSLGQNEA